MAQAAAQYQTESDFFLRCASRVMLSFRRGRMRARTYLTFLPRDPARRHGAMARQATVMRQPACPAGCLVRCPPMSLLVLALLLESREQALAPLGRHSTAARTAGQVPCGTPCSPACLPLHVLQLQPVWPPLQHHKAPFSALVCPSHYCSHDKTVSRIGPCLCPRSLPPGG